MKAYQLTNSDTYEVEAIIVTDMDSEIFQNELYDFLSNNFKNNYYLTVEQFEERLKSKGYNAMLVKIDEGFSWWKSSEPDICYVCGNRMIDGQVYNEIKGNICIACNEYFNKQV